MSYRRAAAGLFVLVSILMVATVRDYGVTWDEPDHRDYGRAILHYYRTGGQVLPADRDLNLYGGAFDALAALAEEALPFAPWTSRHLCTLAAGLLGLAGAWRVGLRLGGPAAGFWAAFLLALTPAWYGHSFNNPQDLPFAAGYLWSLALILDALESLPAIRWPRMMLLGGVLGLTWGVRIGGVLLAFYLVAAAAERLGAGVLRREVAGRLAATLALAWVVMLAGWPAAHQDPVGWPAAALAEFTRFTRLPFAVLFRGQMMNATDIPWTYVPTYLLLTLPEPAVALLLAGPVWAAASRSFRSAAPDTVRRFALVATAAVVPAAFVILRGSVLFNGIRHLLFIVPPLLCLAGAALAAGLEAVGRRGHLAVALLLGLGWGGWQATRLVRIHPYEFTSFNAVAGGLRGTFMRFEQDYWGESFPEALRLITARVTPRTGSGEPPWQVAACGAPRVLIEQLPPGFAYAADPTHADFLVGILGAACGAPRGTLLGYVVREGVPLGYAVDLRAWRAAAETTGAGRVAR